MKDEDRQSDVTGKVNLCNFEDICSVVGEIYKSSYKNRRNIARIKNTFLYADDLFKGKIAGYHACDTPFHNPAHSSGTALAMARIIDGRNKSPFSKIEEEMFVLGVILAVFHDAGYLRLVGDNKGTGAKYTLTHVDRSIDFINENLAYWGLIEEASQGFGLSRESREKNSNIVKYTDMKSLDKIVFNSGKERFLGHALCTADYLSQIASPCYLDKLPLLYEEFVEGGISDFKSAEDLIGKTPDFWRKFIFPILTDKCGSVYRFLENHFEDGRNHYIESIERNINKIEEKRMIEKSSG